MYIEMGFRENIRKEIDRRFNGKASTFSKAVGISAPYINEILSGKRRFNEDHLKKISKALSVPAFQLLADEPLVPYRQVREDHAAYASGPDSFDRIKLFDDPLSLGPGNEISEIPPSDYIPFMKKYLPRGYKSDPDRIVAFPTAGVSMKPTISPGSIVWIDRKDIQPKEGQIYAFWLPDRHAVTVKRIIKIDKRYCIIDGDNRNEEERKLEELRDFPMVIDCQEHDDQGPPWPIRGRVIWILNRLIEESKK